MTSKTSRLVHFAIDTDFLDDDQGRPQAFAFAFTNDDGVFHTEVVNGDIESALAAARQTGEWFGWRHAKPEIAQLVSRNGDEFLVWRAAPLAKDQSADSLEWEVANYPVNTSQVYGLGE